MAKGGSQTTTSSPNPTVVRPAGPKTQPSPFALPPGYVPADAGKPVKK